jgi:hypothetical protein
MRFNPRFIATAFIGLLLCYQTARAEIVYVGNLIDIEISAPMSVGDGSENLLRFNLTALAKNDSLLGAFDGTIGGPLHQQSAGATITPTLDEPLLGSIFVTNIDSHFLINTADVISIDLPTETLGAAASSSEAANASGPDAAQATTNFGTSLSGSFAPTTGFVTSWPLAQLVVPGGSTVELQFDLGVIADTITTESVVTSFLVGSPQGALSDLTGNGFVDFQDLTILLANWNTMVAADQGNLVNPDTTVVNFADLTTLLAAWTGPGPAGAPEAALATEAVPEPSSLILLLAAVGYLPFIRRRR